MLIRRPIQVQQPEKDDKTLKKQKEQEKRMNDIQNYDILMAYNEQLFKKQSYEDHMKKQQVNKERQEQKHQSLLDNFCENSIVTFIREYKDPNNRRSPRNLKGPNIPNTIDEIMYVPAYVRYHCRNMTEMDIQNLSSKFISTMNISFYLGMYKKDAKDHEKETVKKFSEFLRSQLDQNLKIIFQNDFVLNLKDQVSSNASDSDRLIRVYKSEEDYNGVKRFYHNIVVTRQFKFGLRADIFFFPLEQNELDLVTTLNPIKKRFNNNSTLEIRFNCMNLQLKTADFLKDKFTKSDLNGQQVFLEPFHVNFDPNNNLIDNLKGVYMHQNDGKELTQEILKKEFYNQINYYFQNIKLSFPKKENTTQFGHYYISEKEVRVHYTRQKLLLIEQTFYERLKQFLFCKKKVINFNNYDELHQNQNMFAANRRRPGYENIETEEDRALENSYCNTIFKIPMVKSSLGTIIQLIIPIFFLCFLTLIQFQYSQSTSGDSVRGQKIGASAFVVATYISFIYTMRSVIPPTPSWSLFQVAVCILAAISVLPIIESIYRRNYNDISDPFVNNNGIFIITFVISGFICFLIMVKIIGIHFYIGKKKERKILYNVTMDELLDVFTKKYLFLWRHSHCYDFLVREMISFQKQDRSDGSLRTVRYQSLQYYQTKSKIAK